MAAGQPRDSRGRFSSVGIGGILTFNADGALGGMRAASRGFNALQSVARTTATVISGVGSALVGLGVAFTPFAAAVTVGSDQALKFQHQMRAVQAIIGGSQSDMAKLTAEAKRMGATTQFSATESAKAMEEIGRAGATTEEIIASLSGIMNAAAAEQMPLADATTIVAQTVRAMGLQFKDATRIADVLALTSAKTNSTIRDLGVGLTYSTGQARLMGISIEELSAALGLAADAGLQGSLGGTSFVQMMVKMNKPSRVGAAMMAKWGIALTDTSGKLLPLSDLVAQFKVRIDAIKDSSKRGAAMMELFGVRGQKAFAALSTAGPERIRELTKTLNSAAGAAERMAKTRMDSVIGQFVLLKSAVEGFSIEVFTPFLGGAQRTITDMANALGGVVRGIQILRAGALNDNFMGPPTAETVKMRQQWAKMSPIVKSVATGIRDGVDYVVRVFARVRSELSSRGGIFGEMLGTDAVQTIAKASTAFVLLAAAATPALLGVGGAILFIMKIVVPAVGAIKAVLAAVASVISGPVALALGAVLIGILSFKRETESFGEFFGRVWDFASEKVLGFWRGTLLPFVTGVQQALGPVFAPLKEAWNEIMMTIRVMIIDVATVLFGETSNMKTDWLDVGRTVGSVLAAIVHALAKIITVLVKFAAVSVGVMTRVGKFIFDNVFQVLQRVVDVVRRVGSAFKEIFSGGIKEGLKSLAVAIFDFVLIPLRQVVSAAIKVADAVKFPVPEFLRTFAAKGLVSILPEETRRDQTVDGAVKANTAFKATRLIPKVEANVNLKDERTVNVNTDVKINDRVVAHANSRHQKEISERAGFQTTPYQRRVVVEHGAIPLPAGG